MSLTSFNQQPAPLACDSAAYAPAWEVSLRSQLDSTFYFPHQQVVADTLPVRHLLVPADAGVPQEKPLSASPLFWGLLLLYLLLAAVNRLRLLPASGSSLRNLPERMLPQLFLTDRSAVDNRIRRLQLVALALGFAFCIASLLGLSEKTAGTALVLAGCAAYMVAKLLLRFLSAFLLDVGPLALSFFRKKRAVYYNVLFCLVPLASVYALYPFTPLAILFAIILVVANIYLLINAITIFSIKMKLYGIFLYFCTLEIMPAACMVVYMIRSC